MESIVVDVDGKKWRRIWKPGRKPLGLGKAKLYRLYREDELLLADMKEKQGYLYNESEFVRNAVHNSLIYMNLSIQ